MIIYTHLGFGKILYRYLLQDLNFKLDKKEFIYGNIKPDIKNDDINAEHTMDGSINNLLIFSQKIINNYSNIATFSMALGIVCHYICDYFCTYHNGLYKKKNIFEHLVYETYLHVQFTKMVLTRKIKLNFCKNEEYTDLMDLLMNLSNKYAKNKMSITNDINYAISAAAIVSEMLIILAYNHLKVSNSEILNHIELINQGFLPDMI
ncbi:zinc dependent phospholipase C family protein [Desulfitobacterium sp. AusDCA]|uniref:zinc dependent phospholipase C family protein n=1 Tax=Desulfitobacterium sp. AusDCA TaxID=3240383 RepID=UPI003DA71F9C